MMERALKERIIGAVILVIFVVLVVPIFLDGPPADGDIVSERVLLPGQEGQNTNTVVLDRERSDPIPAASSSDVDADKPVAADSEPNITPSPSPAVQQKTDQTPAAREATEAPAKQAATTAKSAQSTTGMWAVQLGSFSNKQNAEKLAADLRKQGYAAFLSQLQIDSGQLHRVRIGPQKDRQSAEAMAARLLKVGHKGQVLPHP
jgi:DedD protein